MTAKAMFRPFADEEALLRSVCLGTKSKRLTADADIVVDGDGGKFHVHTVKRHRTFVTAELITRSFMGATARRPVSSPRAFEHQRNELLLSIDERTQLAVHIDVRNLAEDDGVITTGDHFG